MSGHVHAENMRLYAEDAATTATPWCNWQYRDKGSEDEWHPCILSPLWSIDIEYRRKPRTIMIGGVAVPEPLRTAPPPGTTVYIVDICTSSMVCPHVWAYGHYHGLLIERGVAHLTREAAQQHANALIKFSAK